MRLTSQNHHILYAVMGMLSSRESHNGDSRGHCKSGHRRCTGWASAQFKSMQLNLALMSTGFIHKGTCSTHWVQQGCMGEMERRSWPKLFRTELVEGWDCLCPGSSSFLLLRPGLHSEISCRKPGCESIAHQLAHSSAVKIPACSVVDYTAVHWAAFQDFHCTAVLSAQRVSAWQAGALQIGTWFAVQ